MKNIYLNAGTISDVFNGLENSFSTILNSTDNDFNLNLNTDLIKGQIQGTTFINGITAVQVEMIFFDDVMLSMESLGISSILFAYCDGDRFKYSFGSSGQQISIRKHHSAVINSNRSINTVLHFHKNTTVQFSLIKVEIGNIGKAVNDPLLFNLKKTFLNKQPNYCYERLQNIKIAEKLKLFKTIKAPGMVGHILKKDCIQSILEMEINNNTTAFQKLSISINRSTLNQINEIKKMCNFIKLYTSGSIFQKLLHSKDKILIKSFLEEN
jgi:hypothetical protein